MAGLKNAPAAAAGWTDTQVLAYLLSVIECSKTKLDFNNAPVPAGRTIGGCTQKINKLRVAMRAEIDAIKAGHAASATATVGDISPPKKGRAKRKASEDADVESPPKKKRGGKKKAISPDVVEEEEEQKGDIYVKSELQDEDAEEEV
ncbi:hypothetical protein IQ07DRAFT_642892 [Pyrenochaeta sp. DS3sAY3a]|nr:hypothetical protein IQ07DRAFT_642892 [Pyrenochaeta sp. DS3sAY3a]